MRNDWGDIEPLTQTWSSGLWSLELRGDEIADIHFDGVPIARNVRAVVRDREWGTVPAVVNALDIDANRIVMGVRHLGLGADFDTSIELLVTGGMLRVTITMRAQTDFERNRLGLVVLHPPTLAGAALTVAHTDGSETVTAFPRLVSPHQPAMDIAGLLWQQDGVSTSLSFAGEVFEMEDQRNWTDASFKTYGTPLSEPFPVRVVAGESIEQSITLCCERVSVSPSVVTAAPIALVPAGHAVPSITVSASTSAGFGPMMDLAADAVLVELDTRTTGWSTALERAVRESGMLSLDVRIVADQPSSLHGPLDALAGLALVRVAVYSGSTHVTEPELWTGLQSGMRERGLTAALVGGARSHFTELNRTHGRLPEDLPALTFSVTPQMHARESSQLVESIAMQRVVAESAAHICGGRPVHIGPVTLRPRFNAVATTANSSPDTDTDTGYGAEFVDGATDPRQNSRALAAWTIASAAALSVEGTASISYFETWGPRGVRDADGRPRPVEVALAWLHEISGHPLVRPASPTEDHVWIIGAVTPIGTVVLLANLNVIDVNVAVNEDAPTLVPALGSVRVVLPPAEQCR